jgi:hypothetical protein
MIDDIQLETLKIAEHIPKDDRHSTVRWLIHITSYMSEFADGNT